MRPFVAALPALPEGCGAVVKSSLPATSSRWSVAGAQQLSRAFDPDGPR